MCNAIASLIGSGAANIKRLECTNTIARSQAGRRSESSYELRLLRKLLRLTNVFTHVHTQSHRAQRHRVDTAAAAAATAAANARGDA